MQSIAIRHFAFDYDPGNADPVENVLRKPNSILFAEDKVDLSALVGNKQQRATRCRAEFRAEGMIVSVRMTAEVTICVGDFASEAHSLSWHSLSDQQIHIALLGHPPRSCQVRHHGLHSRKGHTVQPVPISKLESAQSHRGDDAE